LCLLIFIFLIIADIYVKIISLDLNNNDALIESSRTEEIESNDQELNYLIQKNNFNF